MLKTSMSANELASFLTNEEVIQICIGQFQVIINFTNDLSISIQSNLKIRRELVVLEISAEAPDQSKELTCLIGQKIQSFIIEGDTLKIMFSGEYNLELTGDNDGYESLSIVKGEESIYI